MVVFFFDETTIIINSCIQHVRYVKDTFFVSPFSSFIVRYKEFNCKTCVIKHANFWRQDVFVFTLAWRCIFRKFYFNSLKVCFGLKNFLKFLFTACYSSFEFYAMVIEVNRALREETEWSNRASFPPISRRSSDRF